MLSHLLGAAGRWTIPNARRRLTLHNKTVRSILGLRYRWKCRSLAGRDWEASYAIAGDAIESGREGLGGERTLGAATDDGTAATGTDPYPAP